MAEGGNMNTRLKIAVLALIVLLSSGLATHAVRQTIRFPVETRKYVYNNNLVIVDTPAAATSDGSEGHASFDDNYLYYCNDANTWVRGYLYSWSDPNYAGFAVPLILDFNNQDYLFTSRTSGGIDYLCIQGQTDGIAGMDLFPLTGDGTDTVIFSIFGKGTPTALTNTEYISMGYNSASTVFTNYSLAQGTGTVRPYHFGTGLNTSQLVLNVDGSINTSGAMNVGGAFDVDGAVTADSFNAIEMGVVLPGIWALGDGTSDISMAGNLTVEAASVINQDLSTNSTTATLGDIILTETDPPASATATGTSGQIAFDSNYLYRAVATNTWKRVALSTWTDESLLLETGDRLLLEVGDILLLE